ncbi:hypothetical protein TKK_0011557 [Trichogramma kaykai]
MPVDDKNKNPLKKRPRESATPLRSNKRPAGERARETNTLLGVKNPVAPSQGTRSTRSGVNASTSVTESVEQCTSPTSEETEQQLPLAAPEADGQDPRLTTSEEMEQQLQLTAQEEDERGPIPPTSEEAEQRSPPTVPEGDERGVQPTPPLQRNHTMSQPNVFNFEDLARALLSARPAVPTFSGLDHEDPDKYLEKCQAFITG